MSNLKPTRPLLQALTASKVRIKQLEADIQAIEKNTDWQAEAIERAKALSDKWRHLRWIDAGVLADELDAALEETE